MMKHAKITATGLNLNYAKACKEAAKKWPKEGWTAEQMRAQADRIHREHMTMMETSDGL